MKREERSRASASGSPRHPFHSQERRAKAREVQRRLVEERYDFHLPLDAIIEGIRYEGTVFVEAQAPGLRRKKGPRKGLTDLTITPPKGELLTEGSFPIRDLIEHAVNERLARQGFPTEVRRYPPRWGAERALDVAMLYARLVKEGVEHPIPRIAEMLGVKDADVNQLVHRARWKYRFLTDPSRDFGVAGGQLTELAEDRLKQRGSQSVVEALAERVRDLERIEGARAKNHRLAQPLAIEFFAEMRVHELKPEDVEAYMRRLKQRGRTGTFYREPLDQLLTEMGQAS